MTVEELVERTRILVQDTVSPYRYPDTDMLIALNDGLKEVRRMRPDLFLVLSGSVPEFTAVDSTEVLIDDQYLVPISYFMAGWVTLREEEETTEARAASFIQSFHSKLLGALG